MQRPPPEPRSPNVQVRGQAWYLDSSGDLLDGCDTVTETGMQWGDGDVVGLTLDYR